MTGQSGQKEPEPLSTVVVVVVGETPSAPRGSHRQHLTRCALFARLPVLSTLDLTGSASVACVTVEFLG